MPLQLHSASPSFEGISVLRGESKPRFPLLVFFWSTSCDICMRHHPALKEMLSDSAPQDLNVLSVFLPRSETERSQAAQDAALEFEFAPNLLFDSTAKLAARFENQFLPAYYLFDSAGNLSHYQAGGSSLDHLAEAIRRLKKSSPTKKPG